MVPVILLSMKGTLSFLFIPKRTPYSTFHFSFSSSSFSGAKYYTLIFSLSVYIVCLSLTFVVSFSLCPSFSLLSSYLPASTNSIDWRLMRSFTLSDTATIHDSKRRVHASIAHSAQELSTHTYIALCMHQSRPLLA